MIRRRHKNAISLFPFLAVLVCTMGALILLLLVTTRRIRNDQRYAQSAKVDERPADPTVFTDSPAAGSVHVTNSAGGTTSTDASADENVLADAVGNDVLTNSRNDSDVNFDDVEDASRKGEIQNLEQRLASESSRYQALRQRLEDAKHKLKINSFAKDDYQAEVKEIAALRQQETKLSEELRRRKQNLIQLQTVLDSSSEKTEQAEAILSSRESALIKLRRIAEDTERQLQSVGTDQTVVDFTNSTGTQRSPILIDVTEHGFEFLPAGIKVTAANMQGFPANDNPLLSGILRLHEVRHGSSLSIKPYVLLLVRPDGSLPFYAAQRFLKAADVHFGYELMGQEKKIAAGTVDVDEREALRDAILSALTRRQNLYGGLMNRFQVLPEPSATSKSRLARVLPDGRVLIGDEATGHERDGRFYAGGEAPPRQYLRSVKPPRKSIDPEELPGSHSDFAKTDSGSSDQWTSEFDPHEGNSVEALPYLPPAESSRKSGVAILPRAIVDDGDHAASGTMQTDVPEFKRSETQHPGSKRHLLPGDREIVDGASTTPPKGSLAGKDSPRTDDTDPSAPSGWPTSEYPHSESATRTAGPAGDPALTDIAVTVPGTVSGATPRPGTSSAAGPMPDPFLQQLLNQGRSQALSGLVSRVPVTVFIDATALTIGSGQTLNTAGWDTDQVLAAALKGLSREMKFAPSISDAQSLPMVRFVVSPGASLVQLQLAAQLRRTGIPSTAVTVDRSYSETRRLFEGRLDVRTNDSPPNPAATDKASPVAPPGILRPPRRNRRLAI